MREFKKHQPSGTIILRFFVVAAGTALLFLLAVVGVRAAWGMYDTFTIAVEARESAESQLASLRSDKERLTAAVSSFESPDGIEREIRERFGVVRPGEGEIQIVRDQGSTTRQTVEQGNMFFRVLKSFFVW